jgi:hypothetical protein
VAEATGALFARLRGTPVWSMLTARRLMGWSQRCVQSMHCADMHALSRRLILVLRCRGASSRRWRLDSTCAMGSVCAPTLPQTLIPPLTQDPRVDLHICDGLKFVAVRAPTAAGTRRHAPG